MLKTNNVLTGLIISNCSIDADGAILIGDALKQNTTLKRLNISDNTIGDDGAIAIADGIRENDSSSLSSINLSTNNIGTIGASSIATMLATKKSFVELYIVKNGSIGKAGVVAIVEALKHCKALTSLALNDGLGSIATLLTTNVSLKILDVDCIIGVDGAIEIMNAMKFNKSLECLILIAAMLEINTTLKRLYLDYSIWRIDDFTAGVILKTLEEYNDTVDVHIC